MVINLPLVDTQLRAHVYTCVVCQKRHGLAAEYMHTSLIKETSCKPLREGRVIVSQCDHESFVPTLAYQSAKFGESHRRILDIASSHQLTATSLV